MPTFLFEIDINLPKSPFFDVCNNLIFNKLTIIKNIYVTNCDKMSFFC